MKYELNDNYVLEMIQDEDTESPNNWGNTDIFLVYEHRQFQVDREGFKPREINEYLELCEKSETIDLRNDDFDKYWIFTVYAYIHSGVSLSLGRGTCNFDISSTGFILVEKELTRESKKPKFVTEEEAVKYAKGLIETWNIYLSGEIYGFKLYKKHPYTKVYANKLIKDDEVHFDIEEIDSCWGFYGDDIKTNGILDHIDDCLIKNINFE